MTETTPWWLEDDDDTGEPLTPAQIDELADDLATLKESLEEQLAAPSDRTDVVDLDQPIGRVSRVDAMQQQRMAQAQKLRTRGRLSQVALALRAHEEEEYGECRRCGESIGYPRLKAAPEAPLCVPCARSAEKPS